MISFIRTLALQLHQPDYTAKLAEYKLKVAEYVNNAKVKGQVFLIIHHLLEGFKDKLRRNHDWLGVLLPPLDTQVGAELASRFYLPSSVVPSCCCWCAACEETAAFVGAACLQLQITRPQRIATFAGVMLTSMAINAFFFGKGA